jgi:hypothetical protein
VSSCSSYGKNSCGILELAGFCLESSVFLGWLSPDQYTHSTNHKTITSSVLHIIISRVYITSWRLISD